MRIGILTFHRAFNCGAMLQAWALRKVLEKHGHTVTFPNLNHVGECGRWRWQWPKDMNGLRKVKCLGGQSLSNLLSIGAGGLSIRRYWDFRRQHLPEQDCSLSDLKRHYDALVFGSDQVWNAKCAGEGECGLFFAENMSAELRKIAYAVSCGDDPQRVVDGQRLKACMKRFSAISVRERLACEVLQQYTSQTISECLDPTLLLEPTDYDEIDGGHAPSTPYLFMYTLTPDPYFLRTAQSLARRLGVKCVVAPCYLYSRFKAPSGITWGISPDRLVSYTRNAKYVVAASFHGTAMGVLFNKPLLSLRKQIDVVESRPACLLRQIGHPELLVNPSNSIDEMVRLLMSDCFHDLFERLALAREHSRNWLFQSVEERGRVEVC